MNVFKKIQASLRFSEAVRMADEAYNTTSERHYVIANGNDGQLIVMDRSNFRKLKRKGYLERFLTVSDLERECFYSTPYRDGSKRLLPDEVKKLKDSYFRWVVSLNRVSNHK